MGAPQGVNIRASLVAGKQVRGPALVSYVRMRPCEFKTPVVKWESFPLELMWRWTPELLPLVDCCGPRVLPQSVLRRPPKLYRCALCGPRCFISTD